MKQIARELLFQESQAGLQSAVARLFSFLSRLSGLDAAFGGVGHSTDIVFPSELPTGLSNGTAISPRDAAACVLDARRTAKFLRGSRAAVLAAQGRFPGGPIEVLYAGCGPFAPFAVLLSTQFRVDQVQFTLLDIHSSSLEFARRIFGSLGLGAFVRNYVQCDASSYVHQASRAPQIVIIETMQRALEKEPQVAVTLNLAPQLCSGGILIPEKVTVDAWLCDLAEQLAFMSRACDRGPHAENTRIKLGRIFTLTAEESHYFSELLRGCAIVGESRLPAAALDIPREVRAGLKLMLTIKVTIFGSIELDEYESGLTFPVILHALSLAGSGAHIEFSYSLGSNPGFTYQLGAINVTDHWGPGVFFERCSPSGV